MPFGGRRSARTLNLFYVVVLELRKLLSKAFFILNIFSVGECSLLHIEILFRLHNLMSYQIYEKVIFYDVKTPPNPAPIKSDMHNGRFIKTNMFNKWKYL